MPLFFQELSYLGLSSVLVIKNNCYLVCIMCPSSWLFVYLADVLQNLVTPFGSRMQDILPNTLLQWNCTETRCVLL